MRRLRVAVAHVVGAVVVGLPVGAVAADDAGVPSRLTIGGQPLDRLVRTEPLAPFVAFDAKLVRLRTGGSRSPQTVSGGKQDGEKRGKDGQSTYTPALEIAGGYQSLQREPHGWFVSAARPLGGRFAVVGEFADTPYRETYRGAVFQEGHLYTYLGGVRYAFSSSRVTPFVQALAGAVSDRREQMFFFPRRGATFTLHTVAHQVGGGADIRITRRIAVRVAASALTRHYHGPFTRFRLNIGAVFGIGGR